MDRRGRGLTRDPADRRQSDQVVGMAVQSAVPNAA